MITVCVCVQCSPSPSLGRNATRMTFIFNRDALALWKYTAGNNYVLLCKINGRKVLKMWSQDLAKDHLWSVQLQWQTPTMTVANQCQDFCIEHQRLSGSEVRIWPSSWCIRLRRITMHILLTCHHCKNCKENWKAQIFGATCWFKSEKSYS